MLRRLLVLGAVLSPAFTAMGAGLPGQPAKFDLGADVRGVTYFHRNVFADLEWDFAAATSDGVKIIESSATAPGGYVVYTLVDEITGETTAGQDVVAIANPDTTGNGTRELAWVVRTATGLELWCAVFEGTSGFFTCNGQEDLGGGGALSVVAAGAYMDSGAEQDLVVLNGDKVYTMLALGGGFSTPTMTPLSGVASDLAVGEFTGDGLDDVGLAMGGNLVTYQSMGAGSLQQLQILAIGGSLGRVAAGDADGNGIADLAVVDTSAREIRIINGGPSSPPHAPGQLLGPFPAGLGVTRLFDLVFDDRDVDGDDDLAIAGDDWIVLETNAAGSYGYGDALPGLGQTAELVATNTHQDLAQGGAQEVLIYEKGSNGAYLSGDMLLVGRGALASQSPEARACSGNGAPIGPVVRPYGATGWGASVAAGNIAAQPDATLGRDVDEAIFGPGPGPQYGPQVRAYRPASEAWISKVNFYAYGTLRFGVNPAAGDIDGDGTAEIVTGAGAGAVFGPHVRAFRYDGTSLEPVSKVNFFAYSTPKFGVNPSAGSIDPDVPAEIVTGPGPGAIFAPQVRGWNYDGASLTSIGKVNFNAFEAPRYGAEVASGGDFDNDGMAEIAVSPGPGGSEDFGSMFRGFNFDGTSVSALAGFDVTATRLPSRYGASPASTRLEPSSGDSLVGAAGPDPGVGARVLGWAYDGTALRPVTQLDFMAFAPSEGGASVAAGAFYW